MKSDDRVLNVCCLGIRQVYRGIFDYRSETLLRHLILANRLRRLPAVAAAAVATVDPANGAVSAYVIPQSKIPRCIVSNGVHWPQDASKSVQVLLGVFKAYMV